MWHHSREYEKSWENRLPLLIQRTLIKKLFNTLTMALLTQPQTTLTFLVKNRFYLQSIIFSNFFDALGFSSSTYDLTFGRSCSRNSRNIAAADRGTIITYFLFCFVTQKLAISHFVLNIQYYDILIFVFNIQGVHYKVKKPIWT